LKNRNIHCKQAPYPSAKTKAPGFGGGLGENSCTKNKESGGHFQRKETGKGDLCPSFT